MTEQLYTNIPPLRPCMCGHGDHYQINGRCLTSGCGCAGRTVDKTGASEAEFRARVAAFDAAVSPPECDPERVETVARAMEAACRRLAFSDDSEPWPSEDDLRTLAAAAIAADLAPAEEAHGPARCVSVEDANRVLAEARGSATAIARAAWSEGYEACYRGEQQQDNPYRAALASPAPAPNPAKETVRCSRGYTDPEHWIDGYYACPGFASPAPAPQEHRLTEIGNAMGGYDCSCGEPWLTDGCSTAPALQGEEGQR